LTLTQDVAPVSAIISCYNCESSITRAIDSVLNQTLRPAELILVNDASTDKTLSVLNDIASRHAWIKLVNLEINKGAANARNRGWDFSTQTYIAFLDADDAWHPKKIEIQYGFMKDNYDIALCGHEALISPKSIETNWNVSAFEVKCISSCELLISNAFVTPSVMVKRGLDVRFESEKRYMEDHALWMNIAFKGLKVAKLSQKLAVIYKPMYGASGLSSHMWAMEKSELDNYIQLYSYRKIRLFTLVSLILYSLAKYVRRLTVVRLRTYTSKFF
jgi:glycosyltransferase involved in cell wall biosynthesis